MTNYHVPSHASKTELLTIVCRLTGIQARIELPRVGNLTLEYTHPLSDIGSALDASDRQDFLRRLDAPVLAGILMTMLRYKKVLVVNKDHAAATNHNISKASRGHLVKAIELVRRHIVPLDKTHFLPKIVFDFYETSPEATKAIESTIGTLISQALHDGSLVDQVENYFRAHTKATTFDGYSRLIAMERAVEADDAKKIIRHAEAERQAGLALKRLDAERKAKEGMLTKRALQAQIKIVRTSLTSSEFSLKQRSILTGAVASAEMLSGDKLDTLLARLENMRLEFTKQATVDAINACVTIFTHYKKLLGQSMFSIEEELMGLDTVHSAGQAVGNEIIDESNLAEDDQAYDATLADEMDEETMMGELEAMCERMESRLDSTLAQEPEAQEPEASPTIAPIAVPQITRAGSLLAKLRAAKGVK